MKPTPAAVRYRWNKGRLARRLVSMVEYQARKYRDRYGQNGYSWGDRRARRSSCLAYSSQAKCEQCGYVIRWHNQYLNCVGYYPTDTLLERQERVSHYFWMLDWEIAASGQLC